MKKVFLLIILMMSSIAGFAKDVTETSKAKIQVSELAKTTKSWNGVDLPHYSQASPEITILRIKIPAGVKLPMHEHPVINAGVLLSGELTVKTVNKKILHLKAGDPIVEVVDTWHYGINEGEETAEIIVFYAGTVGKKITIKE